MVESVKRSQMTMSLRARAGRINSSTCWARAAAKISSSAVSSRRNGSDPSAMAWCRAIDRATSPNGVPPGSRVRMTRRPSAFSRSATACAWVDLPAPSPPSKVMNTGLGFKKPLDSHAGDLRWGAVRAVKLFVGDIVSGAAELGNEETAAVVDGENLVLAAMRDEDAGAAFLSGRGDEAGGEGEDV